MEDTSMDLLSVCVKQESCVDMLYNDVAVKTEPLSTLEVKTEPKDEAVNISVMHKSYNTTDHNAEMCPETSDIRIEKKGPESDLNSVGDTGGGLSKDSSEIDNHNNESLEYRNSPNESTLSDSRSLTQSKPVKIKRKRCTVSSPSTKRKKNTGKYRERKKSPTMHPKNMSNREIALVKKTQEHHCDLCQKSFRNTGALKCHMAKHSAREPYSCKICSITCKYKTRFDRHIGSHSDEKPHICSVCNKAFKHTYQLSTHRKIHDPGYQPPTCPICKLTFAKAHTLREHMALHNGNKPYACVLCEKSYVYKHGLKEHHKQAHTDLQAQTVPKKLVCEICSKELSCLKTLKQHMLIHSGVRPFICDQCGKGYVSIVSLKRHLAAHLRKKQGPGPISTNPAAKTHACTECDRKFISTESLKKHYNRFHSLDTVKQFQCRQCNKRFCYASELKTHCLNHLENKPHACSECFKTWPSEANLRKHMRKHTGEKPFECEICMKRFSQKWNMKLHLLIHRGEKPHTCHVCSKSFTQASHMKLHFDKHHKNA